jgi:hypothetical protein
MTKNDEDRRTLDDTLKKGEGEIRLGCGLLQNWGKKCPKNHRDTEEKLQITLGL